MVKTKRTAAAPAPRRACGFQAGANNWSVRAKAAAAAVLAGRKQRRAARKAVLKQRLQPHALPPLTGADLRSPLSAREANRVCALVQQHGFTQDAAAADAGVSQPSVSRALRRKSVALSPGGAPGPVTPTLFSARPRAPGGRPRLLSRDQHKLVRAQFALDPLGTVTAAGRRSA
jgi:hypothetical protein